MASSILNAQSISGDPSGGSLRGVITDQSTNLPIRGAGIFLLNTHYGTSSNAEGTFRITNIPPGTYDLKVSCVGYDERVISITITPAETLHSNVELAPHPVELPPVEIMGKDISRHLHTDPFQSEFVPEESPDTYCFRGIGYTIPIGTYWSENALYMYSFDTTAMQGERYIRIWFLYKNISSQSAYFDPMTCMSLDVTNGKQPSEHLLPDSPTILTALLRDSDVVQRVADRVGSVLAAGNKIHSGVNRLSSEFQTPDLKRFTFNWGSSLSIVNPGVAYQLYISAQNDGLLNRHIINPGAAVHGFVYFAFPETYLKAGEKTISDVRKNSYMLNIETEKDSKIIEFSLH